MNLDVRHYLAHESLRDGTPVTVRATRPDDRQRIVEAFAKLEPESVYMRLFRFKKSLTDDELTRLTEPDFERHIHLIATLGEGDAETVIAGANMVVIEPDDVPAARAEVAFTVEEDYQGQGLASALMRHLVTIARAIGLKSLEAEVLAGNAAMLKVFERSGLPSVVRSEAGVVHVDMALGGAG
jgi:RimJ/RimL family protein N-acetyltransferase